ncbi:SGNH/GDSL hydrolase family protein [Actinoplanes aureus]|uniref:SGNH/GDSL hydrolase family protein n=1 Tax=Actinoplanes aureus TaxID=2792083 RepID=A0A931G097_9ACTN|nr:SGNH/GDSL hydrolase family protein [Actinoplanes aureus]MBG0561179.1 SGNH/GDSL hydrolase family protein [Actinoplanes aureus]
MLGRATTRRALLLGGTGTALLAATPGAAGQRAPVHRTPTRVATWATAPTAVKPGKVIIVAGKTIRQVVHLSLGGDRPAVSLTNVFGAEPVRIGAARIALRRGSGGSTAIVPGTDRPLTFNGRTGAVLPAGGALTSDPADLIVPPGADLAISLYLPERTPIGTVSPRSFQSTVFADGDVTAATEPDVKWRVGRYLLLAGVSVRTTRSAATIAAIGDSITVGVNTQENANHRWTDLLATRLLAGDGSTGFRTVTGYRPAKRGVINLGISGNRLLSGFEEPTGRATEAAHSGPSARRRLDRDVLAHPGVRYLITLIGVNDLGRVPGTTADDLIAGHRELVARARSAGLRIFGGTMLPFGGAGRSYDKPDNRAERDRLNAWMRSAGEYDAVIDFDAAIRDPADPQRMLPAYDCGDHLHPNDAGMAALAEAVPLELFAD